VEVFFDPDIQKVFQHSMPELFETLKTESLKRPVPEKISMTIEKYLLRLSFRATPFGWFSGMRVVDRESISQEDQFLMMDISQRKKLSDEIAVNPKCWFEDQAVTVNVYDLKKDNFVSNRYIFPKQILASIHAMRGTGNSKSWLKLFKSRLELSNKEAEELLQELISLQVLVRLTSATAFDIKNSDEDSSKKMAALVIGDRGPQLSQGVQQMILNRASELFSYSTLLTRSIIQDPMWTAATNYMNMNYDHGPVPLMELSESLLATYYPSSSPLRNTSRLELHLSQQAQLLMMKNETVWNLSEQEWIKIRSMLPELELSYPAAIGVLVHGNENLSQLAIQVILQRSASRILGRFGMLQPDISDLIKEIQDFEMNNSEEGILADTEHEFTVENHQNLSIRHSYFEHFIDFYGAKTAHSNRIPLNDLAFQKDERDEWQLIQLSTGKKILIQLSHMVNPLNNRYHFYKLLYCYSKTKHSPGLEWFWGQENQGLLFFPRMQIEQTILTPATWILTPPSEKDWTEEDVKDLVESFRPSIPRHVLLTYVDLKLPLESHSRLFYSEVLKSWKKIGSARLTEDIFGTTSNNYEFVIFGKNENPFKNELIEETAPPTKEACLYWRLYLDPLKMQEVIEEVQKMAAKLKVEMTYLLYPRPYYHIRLRVFNLSHSDKWNNLFEMMRVSKSISRYVKHHYQPEMKRWGGDKGLKLQHQLSSWDSKQKIKHRKKLREEMKPFLAASDSVNWILSWLNFFFLSVDNQKEFILRRISRNSSELNGSYQISIRELNNNTLNSNFLDKVVLKSQNDVLNFLEGMSFERREWWIASIIHLSLNRLEVNFNSGDENAAYKRALKYLSSLKKDQ